MIGFINKLGKNAGDNEDCEDEVKERSKGRNADDQPEDSKAPSMGAKSLCIPFDQPKGQDAIVRGTTKCPQCGENAKVLTPLAHNGSGRSKDVPVLTVCPIYSTTRSLGDHTSARL